MKRGKFFITINLLILGSLFLSIQPRICLEDADCDKKIELRDVVLNAQRSLLVNGRGDTETSGIRQQVFTDTLDIVAGINHISTESLDSDDLSFSNACFLLPETEYNLSFLCYESIVSCDIMFESIDAFPNIFPPIFFS